MGLSETVVAAMIGGLATVSAALFQLFSAFKSNERVDSRVKRGSKIRSLLSIAALMVASAVGGFLYSEVLKQRSAEQMQAMRAELREVKELAALAVSRATPPVQLPAPTNSAAAAVLPVVREVPSVGAASSTESLIYVPTCQAGAAAECLESEAQRVALCGTIPATAQVTELELFAQRDALQQPWEQHVATLDQDLGGARFTHGSFDSAAGGLHKAICVNFLHWSSTPYLARLVVHYGAAAPRTAPSEREPSAPEPVVAGQSAVRAADSDVLPQAASFIAPDGVEGE